jgi:cell division transport system permease protein
MNTPRGVGAGPRPRIAAWLHHHRQAAADSLNKLMLEPVSTLLTWLVVGIALALPAVLLLVLENVEQLTATLDRPTQLSVLMESDASEADAQQLRERLADRPDVAMVQLVTRDAALEQFAGDTGLGDVLATLPENPLPHTLLIEAMPGTDSVGLEIMAGAFQRLSGVSEVVLDTRWVARLQAILEISRRLVLGVGLMMLVGAVLILGNTIRLAIEARRDEIVVIKLIGAGDGFARRPFLYTGLWFGIGGGALAVLIVTVLFVLLSEPVNLLLALYDSERSLTGFGPLQALHLLLLGGALGVISAWQASALHLRRVEPR